MGNPEAGQARLAFQINAHVNAGLIKVKNPDTDRADHSTAWHSG